VTELLIEKVEVRVRRRVAGTALLTHSVLIVASQPAPARSRTDLQALESWASKLRLDPTEFARLGFPKLGESRLAWGEAEGGPVDDIVHAHLKLPGSADELRRQPHEFAKAHELLVAMTAADLGSLLSVGGYARRSRDDDRLLQLGPGWNRHDSTHQHGMHRSRIIGTWMLEV
jgi:hypothetical protein